MGGERPQEGVRPGGATAGEWLLSLDIAWDVAQGLLPMGVMLWPHVACIFKALNAPEGAVNGAGRHAAKRAVKPHSLGRTAGAWRACLGAAAGGSCMAGTPTPTQTDRISIEWLVCANPCSAPPSLNPHQVLELLEAHNGDDGDDATRAAAAASVCCGGGQARGPRQWWAAALRGAAQWWERRAQRLQL
jgi:hypothetical protein